MIGPSLLVLLVNLQKLFLERNERGYIEMSVGRRTGYQCWLTSELVDDNPDREVFLNMGGESVAKLAQLLVGRGEFTVDEDLIQFDKAIEELVEWHSYASVLFYAHVDKGWCIDIDTHHTEGHIQHEVIASVVAETPALVLKEALLILEKFITAK
tara:strand:- start:670 stop:1134 length:465 start_codon:yes stop_codon:yes gene_type:complete